MSFDMSYDRDGRPLKQAQQKPEPAAEAPVVNPQPSHEDMPTMTANGGTDLAEMLGDNPVEEFVEQELPEQPQVQKSVPQQQVQQTQEEDNHFHQLRKRAAQTERERDELARRVAELEAQYARPQQNQRQVVQEDDHDHDEDFSVGADELVEGKHLKQVDKKMRQMQQQLASYQQQSQMNATEIRLKNQYPDFDKVVSRDNIETLRLAYPELAQTLDSSNDLYSKAVSAYTLIKQFGIHREDTFIKDREIAQRNAAKPKPLSTISPQQGDGALSRANAFATADGALTDELKAHYRKDMFAAMKNR